MIFERVLSLGPSCETKLNVVRILRGRAGLDDEAHRVQTHPKNAPSSVFDWQVTPDAALLEYFRRDFRGLFERDDLVRGPSGWVVNARLGKHHPHEFGPYDTGTDIIADRYAEARSRHDYLCSKLRALLARPAPTLFVRSTALGRDAEDELKANIRARNGDSRFVVLTVPTDPDGSHIDWPANYPVWDSAFADISFTAPRRQAIELPGLVALSYGARRFARHVKKMRF